MARRIDDKAHRRRHRGKDEMVGVPAVVAGLGPPLQ